MSKKDFKELFVQESLDTEAWKNLSGNSSFPWNETLLEKYCENVDWKEISTNSGILWTDSMLDKFRRYIDWKELSYSYNDNLFNPERLRKYLNRWDWSTISENRSIDWTIELIEEFKDQIVWKDFINRCDDNLLNTSFIEKFYDYIPIINIKNSRLWDALIDEAAKKLAQRIISE